MHLNNSDQRPLLYLPPRHETKVFNMTRGKSLEIKVSGSGARGLTAAVVVVPPSTVCTMYHSTWLYRHVVVHQGCLPHHGMLKHTTCAAVPHRSPT